MALTLLHTADWHIGRIQNATGGISYDRLSDQEEALKKLLELVEEHDPQLILVAGDLYDTPRPRSEAERLIAEYLPRLTRAGRRLLVAIAGNHDSRPAFATYHNWARPLGILLIGTIQDTLLYDGKTAGEDHALSAPLPGVLRIQLRDVLYPLYLYAFPHLHNSQWPQAYEIPPSDPEKNPEKISYPEAWHMIPERFIRQEPGAYHIFMGHSFCVAQVSEEAGDAPDDEESFRAGGDERHGMEVFHPKLHYVALGHLHRPHQVGKGPIYYPGSLLWYGPHHTDTPRQVILAQWEKPQSPPQISFHKLSLESFQPLVLETDRIFDVNDLLSQVPAPRRALWLRWKGPSHLSTKTIQDLTENYYLFYRYLPPATLTSSPASGTEAADPQYLLREPDELLERFLRHKRWPDEDIQKAILCIFKKYAHITQET